MENLGFPRTVIQ